MQVVFPGRLLAEKITQNDWVIARPFEVFVLPYMTSIAGRKLWHLHVPAGFRTDFASVPRLPLTFLFFGGLGDEAGVIHDYLYQTGLVDRKTADEVLLHGLIACGIAVWKCFAMWSAVRAWGWSHYKPADGSVLSMEKSHVQVPVAFNPSNRLLMD